MKTLIQMLCLSSQQSLQNLTNSIRVSRTEDEKLSMVYHHIFKLLIAFISAQ